jgi:hypothetical protein
MGSKMRNNGCDRSSLKVVAILNFVYSQRVTVPRVQSRVRTGRASYFSVWRARKLRTHCSDVSWRSQILKPLRSHGSKSTTLR